MSSGPTLRRFCTQLLLDSAKGFLNGPTPIVRFQYRDGRGRQIGGKEETLGVLFRGIADEDHQHQLVPTGFIPQDAMRGDETRVPLATNRDLRGLLGRLRQGGSPVLGSGESGTHSATSRTMAAARSRSVTFGSFSCSGLR